MNCFEINLEISNVFTKRKIYKKQIFSSPIKSFRNSFFEIFRFLWLVNRKDLAYGFSTKKHFFFIIFNIFNLFLEIIEIIQLRKCFEKYKICFVVAYRQKLSQVLKSNFIVSECFRSQQYLFFINMRIEYQQVFKSTLCVHLFHFFKEIYRYKCDFSHKISKKKSNLFSEVIRYVGKIEFNINF